MINSLSSSMENSEGNFVEYQQHSGSLSEKDFTCVMSADYSENDYKAAMSAILRVGSGFPDHSFVEMAARIIHIVGKDDPRVMAAAGWLLPETYIFLRRY